MSETVQTGRKEHDSDAEHRPTHITVHVNFKPVKLEHRRVTGLEIKEAAIAQGVRIELDFVLFLELGPRQRRVIADTEKIKIEHGMRFEAIPHDDNS